MSMSMSVNMSMSMCMSMSMDYGIGVVKYQAGMVMAWRTVAIYLQIAQR